MSNGTNAAVDAETTSGIESVVDYGKEALLSVESGFFEVGRWTREVLHSRPYLSAAIGGGLGFGASVLLGVAELAVTGLTAYVGYRMVAYNESLVEAIEKGIQLRKGELLDEIEEEKREKEQKEQEAQSTENTVNSSTVAAAERPGRRPTGQATRTKKTQ